MCCRFALTDRKSKAIPRFHYKAIEFDLIEYPISNLSEEDLVRKAIQEKLQRQRIEQNEERLRRQAEQANQQPVAFI